MRPTSRASWIHGDGVLLQIEVRIMETRKVELPLIRAGFVLFTVALLTGFAIPAFLNPRMAVAAHLSALLNALFLIVLGLTWGLFSFSPMQARLTRAAFLYNAFGNWAVSCVAAAWGTSRATPFSGAGHTAVPWKETLVESVQVSIVLVTLAASVSVLYALRSHPTAELAPAVPLASARTDK
jgi:hydroxylaminobenzene mutase